MRNNTHESPSHDYVRMMESLSIPMLEQIVELPVMSQLKVRLKLAY